MWSSVREFIFIPISYDFLWSVTEETKPTPVSAFLERDYGDADHDPCDDMDDLVYLRLETLIFLFFKLALLCFQPLDGLLVLVGLLVPHDMMLLDDLSCF